MASTTQVIITTTDDIDGSSGASTIKFALDDKQYTIDLTPGNEMKLREAMAQFIKHAKPASPAKAARKATRSTSRSIDVREWARKQGIQVPERGRISKSIIDAYNAAHTSSASLVPSEPEPAPAVLA